MANVPENLGQTIQWLLGRWDAVAESHYEMQWSHMDDFLLDLADILERKEEDLSEEEKRIKRFVLDTE